MNTTNLGHNVTREWLHDEKICAYTFHNGTRLAADVWALDVKKLLDQVPANGVFYWLIDFSPANATLTPYNGNLARQLASYRPDVGGNLAVIVRPNFGGHALRFFAERLPFQGRLKVFFDRESALDWLLANIGSSKRPRQA